jgi:hypothetical protein
MPDTEEKKYYQETTFVDETLDDDDDRELVALGYKPSFKREFTNLATVWGCPPSRFITFMV